MKEFTYIIQETRIPDRGVIIRIECRDPDAPPRDIYREIPPDCMTKSYLDVIFQDMKHKLIEYLKKEHTYTDD